MASLSSGSDSARLKEFSLPRRWKRQNPCAALAGDNLLQPLAPEVQRSPLLEILAVPVVNRGHAGLDVIEDLRNHQALDAGANHEAGGGSAQNVSTELDAGAFDDARDGFLGMTDMRCVLVGARDDPGRLTGGFPQVLQDQNRWRRERDTVRQPFLLREAGIVHQPPTRSISPQVAPLAK
jgi:hypothetical protein